MAQYPIIFRMTHIVRTPLIEVSVRATGRTVVRPEDDGWLCSGVEPGGLIESGPGPAVALQAFMASLRHVLEDLAEDCPTVEQYVHDALQFFATDRNEEQRWNEALATLSATAPADSPFHRLPREVWQGSELEVTPLQDLADAALPEADQAGLPAAA